MKSHISRDDRQFYIVTMQVAAHEAKVGYGKLADELRDMIDAAKRALFRRCREIGAIGEPSRRACQLHIQSRFADMVLDAQVLEQLQRMFAHIREHGLSLSRKLLLVGPPGTGKTVTVSVLAGELGVPLFLVRLDVLITQFMGETAAKLHQVFDAIGSQRRLANVVSEIRRVLNSFLQMLEHGQFNSLIIAATNHPEILDHALFRRFDNMIEYHLPNIAQAGKLIRSRLGGFVPKAFPLKAFSVKAEGLSYAEIRRAVDDAIKERGHA